MTEIITVQNVAHPAPGKKQGKVFDTQNRTWYVWPDKVNQFHVGQSYEILRADSKQFNGSTYVTISEFRPAGGISPQAQQAQAAVQYPPPPSAQYPSPTPQQVAVPRVATDAERRMDIFICGAVNNWLANTNTDINHTTPADVIRFITMMKEVWKRTLGPNADQYSQNVVKPEPSSTAVPSTAAPTTSVDIPFNDKIPF